MRRLIFSHSLTQHIHPDLAPPPCHCLLRVGPPGRLGCRGPSLAHINVPRCVVVVWCCCCCCCCYCCCCCCSCSCSCSCSSSCSCLVLLLLYVFAIVIVVVTTRSHPSTHAGNAVVTEVGGRITIHLLASKETLNATLPKLYLRGLVLGCVMFELSGEAGLQCKESNMRCVCT